MSSKKVEHRRLVALEAARLMSETGLRDYYQAKSRAAHRLGMSGDGVLPRNSEVEQALRDHLSLFEHDDHQHRLEQLRNVALEALEFFAAFSPRLVGPVLSGTADRHSAVCLHVYLDAPETFSQFLAENGIPYDLEERTIRLDRERSASFGAYLFAAGEVALDVVVLPEIVLRQPPISPIDGRPMNRASLSKVQALLGAAATDQLGENRKIEGLTCRDGSAC
jgi:hypothetical protein